jgi:hypothetical protein
MKKALSLLLCSLSSVVLYGQSFAVSADKMNVAYEGVFNELTIVLENCNCDKLVVSTDNGTLVKSDKRCGYILSKAKPGFANFLVQKREVDKLTKVGEVKYKVLPFPLPSTGLAGRRDKSMPIQIFKVQLGIANAYYGCAETGTYPILSFRVEILRDKILIFSRENSGNYFDAETKQFFSQKLKPGDTVFFKNIKCDVHGRNRLLESFYIEINP